MADDATRGRVGEAPAITSAMIALAWCVLHCPSDDESARVLAQLIINAAER